MLQSGLMHTLAYYGYVLKIYNMVDFQQLPVMIREMLFIMHSMLNAVISQQILCCMFPYRRVYEHGLHREFITHPITAIW